MQSSENYVDTYRDVLKNNELQRVKRFYIFANLGSLILLAVAISVLILTNYQRVTLEHADELRAEIMRSKREFIQNAVQRTVQYIEMQRDQCLAARRPCDEDALKESLHDYIRSIRLKDNGYIWVNAVLNYDGGDNYAFRFVHPNLPETEGMMLSTSLQDIKGNTPYLTELEGVKRDGEIFFEYWFKKMGSDVIQHKMTYAKLFKPYDWIVATGVYLDDIEEIVAAGKIHWEESLRRNVIFAMLITTLASIIAWVFSILVGRRVNKIYNYFISEVAQREEQLRQFNLGLEDVVVKRTQQIAASEQKFLDLYENSPDMYVTVNGATSLIEQCNKTLLKVTGYAMEEVMGQSVFFLYHPDCLNEAQQAFQHTSIKGQLDDTELTLQRKDGSKLEVSLSVTSMRDNTGGIAFSRLNMRDISERKRNEAINRARLNLMQFAASHSMEELLEEALNEAEILTDSRISFYHVVNEDQETLTLQTWSSRTKREFCQAKGQGDHYPVAQAGVWVDCVHEHQPVIHNDYTALPHRKGLPEGHPHISRELVVPIMRGGLIRAILGVGNKPVDYIEQDITAVSLLIDLVWEIVERKQVDNALLQLNEDLEQRIKDRTIELETINHELERMNQLFVGRELRMEELKKRIRKLEKKLEQE